MQPDLLDANGTRSGQFQGGDIHLDEFALRHGFRAAGDEPGGECLREGLDRFG